MLKSALFSLENRYDNFGDLLTFLSLIKGCLFSLCFVYAITYLYMVKTINPMQLSMILGLDAVYMLSKMLFVKMGSYAESDIDADSTHEVTKIVCFVILLLAHNIVTSYVYAS